MDWNLALIFGDTTVEQVHRQRQQMKRLVWKNNILRSVGPIQEISLVDFVAITDIMLLPMHTLGRRHGDEPHNTVGSESCLDTRKSCLTCRNCSSMTIERRAMAFMHSRNPVFRLQTADCCSDDVPNCSPASCLSPDTSTTYLPPGCI